jgi:hypothetical protein
MASTSANSLATAQEQPIERLRTEHKLRTLLSEEEGIALHNLPAGVYGFSYAPATETPLFSRKSYHSYEVHRIADGSAFLIAFVTPADAERARSHKVEMDITVYPDPYAEATTLVRLPFDRILSNHYKPIRYDGNALHLRLAPST